MKKRHFYKLQHEALICYSYTNSWDQAAVPTCLSGIVLKLLPIHHIHIPGASILSLRVLLSAGFLMCECLSLSDRCGGITLIYAVTGFTCCDFYQSKPRLQLLMCPHFDNTQLLSTSNISFLTLGKLSEIWSEVGLISSFQSYQPQLKVSLSITAEYLDSLLIDQWADERNEQLP